MGKQCTVGTMDFFGKTYPVYSLVARNDNRGTPMSSALAHAFGGNAGAVDYSCKRAVAPASFELKSQAEGDLAMDWRGSVSSYRNVTGWDLPMEVASIAV